MLGSSEAVLGFAGSQNRGELGGPGGNLEEEAACRGPVVIGTGKDTDDRPWANPG